MPRVTQARLGLRPEATQLHSSCLPLLQHLVSVMFLPQNQ